MDCSVRRVYRAVIKFFTRKRLSVTEIIKELADVYGHFASSYCSVAKWRAEFKDPTRTLEGAPRSEQSPTTMTNESIRTVHDA